MRLAQLARKLSLKSSAIVDFLATQGVVIEENPNTKIDDAHVRTALAYFAPALLEVEVEAITQEKDQAQEQFEVEPAPAIEVVELPLVLEDVSQAEMEAEGSATTATLDELPNVIRAPKIELGGLKVLGKIELPEKKKKEETELIVGGEVAVEVTAIEPSIKLRERKITDRNRADRPRRNPLSEAREREKREEEERRKAEEEKRKELRKQKYLQTRQAKAPSRVEKVKVEKEVKKAPVKKKKEDSVSWLTRFMRWLTSNQS